MAWPDPEQDPELPGTEVEANPAPPAQPSDDGVPRSIGCEISCRHVGWDKVGQDDRHALRGIEVEHRVSVDGLIEALAELNL